MHGDVEHERDAIRGRDGGARASYGQFHAGLHCLGDGLESSRILRSFRVRDNHPYVVHRSTHVACPIDRTPLAF